MTDDVVSVTIAIPGDDDATVTFAYSREGMTRYARALHDGLPFRAAMFLVSWDLRGDDGTLLPIDAGIPQRMVAAIANAAYIDAHRRFAPDRPLWEEHAGRAEAVIR